ncbi:CHAT domain-containing protein [Aquimarina sp. 2304DJ70-9]|uniref:CHAT domain-containing protein n=1 Tax=Aquimarina penaris TaxID=3231044 RepID=UPI00346302DD
MKPLPSLFLTPSFWIILFMISSNVIHAQVENDTLLASQYFKTADSLQTDKKHKESIEFFQKALAIYEKAEAWEKVASCYNSISMNQYRNRKLKESFYSAKKVLEISTSNLAKNTRERAAAYDNIGAYYLWMSKYDKALTNYEKSLKIKRKILPEIHYDIAVSYSNLGIFHRNIAKYEKALYFLKKSLAINLKIFGPEHPKTSNDYNNIGNTYNYLGECDKALEYLKKDLDITIKKSGRNDIYVGYSYVNIGITYDRLNHNDKALDYFERASLIFIEKESTYPLFVSYNNLTPLLSRIGRYDEALQYCGKSLDLALKMFEERHPNIAACYWNFGFAYEGKEKYEKALEYYSKALDILEAVYDENHADIAILYGNIGSIYISTKDFDKALIYHQKALEINNSIFEKDNPEISRSYISIGNLYFEKKMYVDALFYYQKALGVLQNSEKQNPLALQALNQVATAYDKQKNYQKSIVFFDKAIMANTKNTNHLGVNQNFDPNQYYDLKLLLETFQGKAMVLKSKYVKDDSIGDLNKSIEIYKRSDILINHIRQTFTNYQDKVTFAKQAKEVYQGAIEAQLLVYDTENDQHALEKAFYYAEKSKANTLKELLNDANAKNFTGLPTNLVTSEKELRLNKAFYQSKVTEELSEKDTDSSKITQYENKLFDINRKQDSLTDILEKNYPKYYQLKHKNDIVSVSKLQQQLNERTTLLEFFTSDSITYAFTISKNKIAVQELATTDLTKKVETFREAITSKHVGNFKASSHQLYNELIDPIADQLVGDELIIIPDGPLWHLNVELLLTQNKDSNNPKDLPYLLNNYAISYANSANLLFTNNKDTQKSKKQEECLAFSFTDSTSVVDTKTMSLATLRDAGDDLPGTRKEIKAIAEIIDGQYYFGSEAIEANFKKNASQYNILHLALHGEVDNERPENSKLYFTKSKDTIEDNLLYGHELFALDIPAELTVLSACNTGSGKIAKGEGIMSLGTAFQYAGTKSLLLTSWEVSDQTTPELMKYFYTNLKEGMNKAKALQQAKLQYLKTADINRTHPFYWGGFYLVGDAAAIPFSDHTWWYWVLGLGILCLIVFRYRKRKRNS